MSIRTACRIVAVILAAICLTGAAAGAARVPGTDAVVLGWLDGDTVRVRIGPREETVRLIGIDAPESSPNERARDQARRMGISLREVVELGRRARDAASRLGPPGTRVRLEPDVQPRDRYGRLLAYVWLPDGTMLNERLLRDGWAVLLTVPPNVRYVERLVAAQREARERGAGLWGGGSGGPQDRSGRCDPSYPDVCIPPPPPDLDCRDIPYRHFRVLPPDSHRFDRDGDGIGCER